MWLIDFSPDVSEHPPGTWPLVRFDEDKVPPYAILSHRWGRVEDEVLFKHMPVHDLMNRSKLGSTKGQLKLRFCATQLRRDGLRYLWVDTCCIDKANSVELSEAIISMYAYYRDAARCYVYLTDVTLDSGVSEMHRQFAQSSWFTRGWTLQELIAPSAVDFFTRDGDYIGSKAYMRGWISEVTGIPPRALIADSFRITDYPRKEVLGWAQRRETSRREDQAYCLIGIFDISMPVLYGERDKAWVRLHDELDKAERRRGGRNDRASDGVAGRTMADIYADPDYR